MAKKIQLQDANGNVLHPLTLGECVTMDNGENLDTLMSKSQMFTPTITQDKSMFKVGAGVDVDYSVNVKDGAYESLAFKGKSLVNLLSYSFPSRTNWHDNAGANSYIRTGQSISMLKPNTDYLMWFEGEKTIVQILALSTVFTKAYFELTGKSLVKVRTVNGELPANFTIHFKSSVGGSLTDNEKASVKLMLIEYQEGMESWEIPYFDGIGYAKMPILRNVGKNLFNDQITFNFNGNDRNISNKTIEVKKGVTYTLSISDGVFNVAIALTRDAKTMSSIPTNNDGNVVQNLTPVFGNYYNITFTAVETGNFYLHFRGNGVAVSNSLSDSNIQLEQGSTATPYENHKTNILRTSEEIVLREVGGVCDTYNPLTGEYVQRIGELVVNGSESWGAGSLVGDTMRFGLTTQEYKIKTSSDGLCDKIPYIKWNSEDVEHVRADGTTPYGNFIVWIKTSRLSTSDTQGFKQWLSQNPLTVQYHLAEPITTIVKPSTMTPFAYQKGHVIVESGYEGQSLLPEVEYSVVTGRTGQVTQNAKTLRKQEQQITSLEELLLTQIVQMEYERTLLQFDYELQMMMLG